MTLSWPFVVMTAGGLTFGTGVFLLVLSLRGHANRSPGPQGSRLAGWAGGWSREKKLRWSAAVAAALLTLLITRWVTVALAVAGVVVLWPKLFGGARDQARQMRKLEALAGWVESLRDIISTGQALPEALPISARTAAPEIAAPLAALIDRMHARQSLDHALLLLADDLDDPDADSVIGALAMNARVQGKRLNVVLTSLAEAARKQLAIRREIEAGRASTRRGVSLVIVVCIVFVVGMTLFNRDYVAPYSTATGQLVLATVIALFATGLFWLRRLSDFTTHQRFLATPKTLAAARRAAQNAAAAEALVEQLEHDVPPGYGYGRVGGA